MCNQANGQPSTAQISLAQCEKGTACLYLDGGAEVEKCGWQKDGHITELSLIP